VLRGDSYRLQSDSLAIRTACDGKRQTITVPSGTTVAIGGPIGGRRLIEVDWNGEKVLLFADDSEHSEASFFCDSRTLRRGVGSTEMEGRERALIEHSMDLAESNQELERFAFAAAHDLYEPLRTIRGMVELFLERNGSTLDKESAEMLTFIVGSADRMGRLIRNLLDFATLDQEVETAEIDTEAVVTVAVRELKKAVEDSRWILASLRVGRTATSKVHLWVWRSYTPTCQPSGVPRTNMRICL
jgi:signal transduction histidine kinase